jgi:hypothetical protein
VASPWATASDGRGSGGTCRALRAPACALPIGERRPLQARCGGPAVDLAGSRALHAARRLQQHARRRSSPARGAKPRPGGRSPEPG